MRSFVRIGSRESILAVRQAEIIRERILAYDPEISVEDQQIVDDAVTALRSAADGLVLKPDDGNDGSGDTQEPDDGNTGNGGSGDTQEPDGGNIGNDGSGDTQEPDDGNTGNAGSSDTQEPDDGNIGNGGSGDTQTPDNATGGSQGSGNTQTAANGNAGNNHSSSGGASADKAAKTGDTAPLTGLLALIMVSGAAVAVTLRKRSR